MNNGRKEALERQLADRLDAGDVRGAAGEAVRGYGPEIAAYLRAVLRDPAEADEVFSRVCENLWRGLGRFRRESSLRTWLYRIAWNTARDFEKEGGRVHLRRLRTSEFSKFAAEVLSSQPAYARSSSTDAIEQLRASLEPEEQTLLTLRLHAGLSWKEVAAVLASPAHRLDEAAVRKRFERLKLKLREMAKAAGLIGA